MAERSREAFVAFTSMCSLPFSLSLDDESVGGVAPESLHVRGELRVPAPGAPLPLPLPFSLSPTLRSSGTKIFFPKVLGEARGG